jgi:putative transposase
MKTKRIKDDALPTIWRVSDVMWEIIEPIILECDPPAPIGRHRIDARGAFDAIIYVMRTGCQWNQLPAEYPDDSSVHRTMQRWIEHDVFLHIWASLVMLCALLDAVDWEWQAADTSMGKARSGGEAIGKNPTDRAKMGVKRSVITEGSGYPLGVVIAGANVVDFQLLRQTIQAIVVPRPTPSEEQRQHLSLDKGYDNPVGQATVEEAHYVPHIRRKREAVVPSEARTSPPRRWKVERLLAWLSKCRGIMTRYAKKAENYLAFIQVACILLWMRRLLEVTVLR